MKEPPSTIQVMAYVFFIGGYFCGPQFSLKHFERSLQRNRSSDFRIPITNVLTKITLIVVLLLVILANHSHLTTTYVVETKEFLEMTYAKRFCYWTLWGHMVVVKYSLVWSLAEGVVILSGIGFNGKSEGTYLFTLSRYILI